MIDPLLPLQIEILEISPDRGVITAAGVLILVVLIGLSGFFSSSEIAMFSLPNHRIEALVEDAVPGAKTLQELNDDPHRLLVTILVGNNVVNIAMSSIATGLSGLYLSRGQSVLAATFGITTIVLLFGESAPKSYAVENTESWALRIAQPVKYSEYVLFPLVVVFDTLTRAVNRITGGQTAIETTYVTRDEIQEMIETGEREGVIETDERKMLDRIFRFTSTIVKEVMTPRLDITAVSRDASIKEAIDICVETGRTRLPVYEGSLDNVLGIVRLNAVLQSRFQESSTDVRLDDFIEQTLQIPESKNVDELLDEMRDERVQMAIVINEFGTTEGIVTTEDLVEEIVGEILDQEETHPIEIVDEGTIRAKGDVKIEDVNTTLNVNLPEEKEFETIAGFIFNQVGRLVDPGEEITAPLNH